MLFKRWSKKKIIVVVASTLLALILLNLVGMYSAAVIIYSTTFDYRCTTEPEEAFEVSDFENLARDRHTFQTKQGHTLVGYLYQNSTATPRALLVFAHGLGGGGQTGYMDIIYYFCTQGYLVFAYDATGNDESEGDAIGGFPQGYIDLDYAITYAQSLDEVANLPTVLMGYSWGGLSVANTLGEHPDVKAVAAVAGWNRSKDMIEYYGCNMVGPMAKVLMPFVGLHERIKYGKDYASSTALDGFENSDCDVMIVHGELDDTIPIEYGYDLYYEQYKDDPRFTFKRYDDRDHLVMRDSTGAHDMALMAEIAAFFDAALQ